LSDLKHTVSRTNSAKTQYGVTAWRTYWTIPPRSVSGTHVLSLGPGAWSYSAEARSLKPGVHLVSEKNEHQHVLPRELPLLFLIWWILQAPSCLRSFSFFFFSFRLQGITSSDSLVYVYGYEGIQACLPPKGITVLPLNTQSWTAKTVLQEQVALQVQ